MHPPRLGAVATLAAAAAASCAFASSCAEDDPRFGDPSAIAGKVVPGVDDDTAVGDGGVTAPFPAPYDPASPPAPAQNGSDIHQQKAGFALTPTTACMGCHAVDGGQPSAAKWAFAGIAYGRDGKPAKAAEVIVVEGTKAIGPVKTAPDGYFWIGVDAGTVGPAAKTAVRESAGAPSKMTQALAGNGSCNDLTCHGGAAGKIDFR